MNASVLDTAERRFFEADDDGTSTPHSEAPAEASRLFEASPRAFPVPAECASLHVPSGLSSLREVQRLRPAELSRHVTDAFSVEVARGTAFCFVPVLLIAGALGYFFAPVEPGLWALLGAAALPLAGLLMASRRSLMRVTFAALFCIALGALLAKAETVRASTQMLGSEISTRLTGRIVAMDHLANGRVRLLIDVVATERPKLRYAPERIRVSARSIPVGTKAGDMLSGVVRLLPPLGPTRPGSYDFSFESYFDRIGAVGFFLTAPARVDASEPPHLSERFTAAVENARDALAARIRGQIGGAEGEIAAALITGVRAGIPEEVNESLRRTGLAHILSISGLHMALVAAWIIGAMRLGFACFQNFTMRHPVRKYAAVVALAALAAYLFLSGNQVAAQRSFVMIAIMLVAVLFDRAALTMRNLALAAMAIVMLSPHEAAGPSFQMSFGATAALIGAYAAWSEWKRRKPGSLPGTPLIRRPIRMAALYVGGLAVTSLLAGAATAIFGAYHFQRVSPLGLVANLAAMPVVSLLVMPFALLGVLLMPLGLDSVAFSVMGQGLRMVLAISEWVSAHSPFDVVGMIPPEAAILLSLALILASLLTTWLRAAAAPFAVAGLTFCLVTPQPKILLSEDARLVAINGEDGTIYVNRKRPNDFTMDNWQRALRADAIGKPVMARDRAPVLRDEQAAATTPGDPIFQCSEAACLASSSSGTILTTSDAELARRACGEADVIVLDDATAEKICAGTPTLVITSRDLARRGSAMIFVKSSGQAKRRRPPAPVHDDRADGYAHHGADRTSRSDTTSPEPETQDVAAIAPIYSVWFAVPEPYRPWHAHRRFSRAARGLAPWKPDPSKAPHKKENLAEVSGSGGAKHDQNPARTESAADGQAVVAGRTLD